MNTINDNDIDKVLEVLDDNKPENEMNSMSNAKELAESYHEVEEGFADIIIDPNTGKPMPVVQEEIKNVYNINEKFNILEIDNGELDDFNNEKFKDAVLSTAKGPGLSISDDSALMLLTAIDAYKKGETGNKLYNMLPMEFKKMTNDLYINSKGKMSKSKVVSFLLDNFIAEANMEKEIVDFQKTMEQTLDIPSIMDMYSDHIKDVMETKTLESAARLETAGETDKANILRKISKTFTDTYTFDSLKSHLHNDRKARNHITKDVKNYNKFCRNFNYMIENSKFAINDVSMIAPVLNRIIPSAGEDNIKKFVILFCKRCEHMDTSDVVDCAYMYYFIKNIITLDYITEKKTSFSKILIENIISMIDEIKTVEKNHNAEVEYIRKNKKGKYNYE